jgi:Protein of unknown function (DUF3277)
MGGFLATPVGTTYAFKDLTGVLNNPVALDAPIQLVGGNIGLGELSIRMLTQRTEHEVGTDGVVMPSYVAGQNAELTIQVQQTSPLHHALLDLYNTLTSLADNGDVSGWASTTISLRTILDGSGHFLAGVSFQKIPDKPYAAKGQNVTWVLMAASCVNQ